MYVRDTLESVFLQHTMGSDHVITCSTYCEYHWMLHTLIPPSLTTLPHHPPSCILQSLNTSVSENCILHHSLPLSVSHIHGNQVGDVQTACLIAGQVMPFAIRIKTVQGWFQGYAHIWYILRPYNYVIFWAHIWYMVYSVPICVIFCAHIWYILCPYISVLPILSCLVLFWNADTVTCWTNGRCGMKGNVFGMSMKGKLLV